MIQKILWVVGVAMLCAICAYSQPKNKVIRSEKAYSVSEKNIRLHIGYLASDKLEGRRTGTKGEKMAADYIEAYYKKIAILPLTAHSYQIPFEIDEGLIPSASTGLKINGHTLVVMEDYYPFAWSKPGKFDAKILLALKEYDAPWHINFSEIIESNKSNPHFLPINGLREYAKNAERLGARALLVFTSNAQDTLMLFDGKDKDSTSSIPVVYITQQGMEKLEKDSLQDWNISAQIDFEQKIRKGINVAAFLNNYKSQTVVIGAHFDHLGHGEDGNSMDKSSKAIHNGADDNASGTVAVMELARILKSKSLSHNILFLHFSGEELGLFGSKQFVENSPLPIQNLLCMINLDMVGRLDEKKSLTIGGIGTSPFWYNSIHNLQASKKFTLILDSSGVGPSDHTSFYRKNIPVLFFFTGLHSDYHKPTDDANFINYSGEVEIIHTLASLVEAIPKMEKMEFNKTKEPAIGGAKFKVTLGIMPDYAFAGPGVRADGVIEGKAAQKIGLKPGDIVTKIGANETPTLELYMQALSKFKKGDETHILVKRNDTMLQFLIQF